MLEEWGHQTCHCLQTMQKRHEYSTFAWPFGRMEDRHGMEGRHFELPRTGYYPEILKVHWLA